MRDGSIRPEYPPENRGRSDSYRVELVTPVLKYEDLPLLQRVIAKLRDSGAKANESCGIHVHIDGANHNADSLKRLVEFITARQDLFYEALEIQDRARNWCKKYDASLLRAIRRQRNLSKDSFEAIWYSRANGGYRDGISHEHYNSTRYHGVNLHSYFSKGTVEFRLFNSTMDDEKIKGYVQLCLGLSAWAINATSAIAFHKIDSYTPEQKITIMRNILCRRLGLRGKEFKACRRNLLAPLEKSVAA